MLSNVLYIMACTVIAPAIRIICCCHTEPLVAYLAGESLNVSELNINLNTVFSCSKMLHGVSFILHI